MGGKAGGLSSQCGIVFSVSNELAADRDPSLTNFSEQKFFFSSLVYSITHTRNPDEIDLFLTSVVCVCFAFLILNFDE